MSRINEFFDDYRFLSNFYVSHMIIDDIEYQTVEHYYQSMKAKNPWSREIIRRKKTPFMAKKMGRSVKLRDDWEEVKIGVMLKALREKFRFEDMRRMLLDTGDKVLEEGNSWGDTFWGIDNRTGEGENHLGKLLMMVREELQ